MSSQLKIVTIVLAAGRSVRMGEANKLLMSWNGIPLIERTLDNVVAAKPDEVLVVTGHQSEQLENAVARFDVRVVHNENYASGLASSLKAGIAALGRSVEGALVVLGDMPLVEPGLIRRLVDSFEKTSDICLPVFEGNQGNPVLWGRDYFKEIQMLTGDRGAKELLSKHQSCVKSTDAGTRGVLRDFDEPADFK